MSTTASVPMTGDVAELIGAAAERVENRSLLLDKFVFHKKWPVVEEQTRRGRDFVKWDEASRWSFIRIADGASQILNREAQDKRRKASGQNVEPENRERYNAEAKIAETLANVTWDSKELQSLRSRHTRRFLNLFRSAYGSERSSVTIGQLEGRLAINLADSLIQNAGICLDRLFGLPYIPGSAIKGVCRHAALAELKATPSDKKSALLRTFCAVFGTSDNDFTKGNLRAFESHWQGESKDQKGAIAFLPAYPVNEARVVVDLTNVHFPDYYRSGLPEDQAKENPRPNPFPAVEAGAQFAFCIVLNGINLDPTILPAAKRWLGEALTVHGLGAKTAAGYGWFSLQPEVLQAIEAEEQKEVTKAAAEADAQRKGAEAAKAEDARKATLDPVDLAAEELLKINDEAFAIFAKDISSKDEAQQRGFIRLLGTHKEKRERWKTWKKRKPELAASIQAVCAKLSLPALP